MVFIALPIDVPNKDNNVKSRAFHAMLLPDVTHLMFNVESSLSQATSELQVPRAQSVEIQENHLTLSLYMNLLSQK